jgi:hypothetical protein
MPPKTYLAPVSNGGASPGRRFSTSRCEVCQQSGVASKSQTPGDPRTPSIPTASAMPATSSVTPTMRRAVIGWPRKIRAKSSE